MQNPTNMTPTERRASASLALVFALRMLGLFLVLPVFALEAAKYPGGDDPARVGLAMGIYGLTQALLQIPLGLASDRLGRKRVIVAGMLVFMLGSVIAAWAPSVNWLVVGRAVQGGGAISAAITALLSDLTRDEVRTKAMALVGVSIGTVFALSLVIAPVLNHFLGLSGLLGLMGVLALAGIGIVLYGVPHEPARALEAPPRLMDVLRDKALLRLDLGVFVLHAVQLAMWMAVPALLVQAGLPKAQHWQAYLPAVLGSFVLMGATLFKLERRGHLRTVFLGSIALIALVQLGLGFAVNTSTPGLLTISVLLFLFFCGFNVLEASQPSLVSRMAPAHARGSALGVYNTLQSLGFFTGGALGGYLLKTSGPQVLFTVCGALMVLWLGAAWAMKIPTRHIG